MYDCENISSKIHSTDYNYYSLTKLFETYYDCKKTKADFAGRVKKLSASFGLVAGASLTTLQFKGPEYEFLTDADFSNSFAVTGGIFLDLRLPRNLSRWVLHNGLIYTSHSISGSYEDHVNNRTLKVISNFSHSYLKIHNIIRYLYPIGNLHLVFGAGISNSFALTNHQEYSTEKKFYSTTTRNKVDMNETFKKYEQGFIFSAGVDSGKLFYEARFEYTNGFTQSFALKSILKRYYILLGYNF